MAANTNDEGSIGNLASAATVAASSFGMSIKDPQELIDRIDPVRWESLKGRGSLQAKKGVEPQYVEPPRGPNDEGNGGRSNKETADAGTAPEPDGPQKVENGSKRDRTISGRVQMLGDFIDTDAVSLLLGDC